MDDEVRIKSGALDGRSQMPGLGYFERLPDGKVKGSEIGFRTDEEALYIGTPKGNVRLCGANDMPTLEAEITALKNQIAEIIARIDDLTNPNG